MSERVFGVTRKGERVRAFALEDGDMRAEVLDYGCTVRSLVVPDAGGRKRDVVLGYDDLVGYENGGGYLGAAIGRYGNRIAKGRLKAGGKEYALAVNDKSNHLHGGAEGFDKKVWGAERLSRGSVRFFRLSPHLEENYPGNLQTEIVVSLERGALLLSYRATCDRDTAVNLTNHSYFNLNGGGSALKHRLRLDASRYVPIDAEAIPLGGFAAVSGTPFDFREEKEIGRDIGGADAQLAAGCGYDHHFEFDAPAGRLREAGRLTGDVSGISVRLLTDCRGVQFYSGNYLDQAGKGGAYYRARYGVCLETQTAPDSPNRPELGNPFLAAGETYVSRTVYAFDDRFREEEI